eukprot:1157296-Pelagomonas_calceolata.AAC.1
MERKDPLDVIMVCGGFNSLFLHLICPRVLSAILGELRPGEGKARGRGKGRAGEPVKVSEEEEVSEDTTDKQMDEIGV